MANAYSYPGVYVEEIPSGVRTISGVTTSVTAFLGRAPMGNIDKQVVITSWSDFERKFGGLNVNYPLSYAVRDYYLNGGSLAIIVRLYKLPDPSTLSAQGITDKGRARLTLPAPSPPAPTTGGGTPADPAAPSTGDSPVVNANPTPQAKKRAQAAASSTDASTGTASTGSGTSAASSSDTATLVLEANSPGVWGNQLQAWVDYKGFETSSSMTQDQIAELLALAESLGLTTADDLFNLYIKLLPDGPTESFLAVSMADGVRRVDRVLSAESALMRVANTATMATSGRPPATSYNTDLTPVNPSVVISPYKGDDGQNLDWNTALGSNDGGTKTGIYALDEADIFNLLCIPPDTRSSSPTDYAAVPANILNLALKYCVDHRAMLIVDPPNPTSGSWLSSTSTLPSPRPDVSDVGLFGQNARNAAVFYPLLVKPDPLRKGQLDQFAPCGAVAGIIASTDSTRGVWKAPAGLDASLQGVQGLSVNLTDLENGQLNPQGINCLRIMPGAGPVVWGARTLRGADRLGDEYRYISVRRTALYIEESLYRGTQWVVFEPNDEPLWAQIRLNVGAFKPSDAYLVKCDKETMTQDDINRGIVNILVGFAPLKPAEFVVIKLQQLAGQLAT